MSIDLVLVFSLLLHLAAAGVALSLIQTTRWRWTCIGLAAAMGLAAADRLRTLWKHLSVAGAAIDLHMELVGLVTSLLMLAAAMLLRLVFGQMRSSELAARQAEELARRRLAELESLYQSAPVGLALLDCELRYVRINNHLANFHGLPASEHAGRQVRDVIPELAPVVEPILRGVLRTGRAATDVEIRGTTPAQPGVERDWLVSYHPVKGEDRLIVGINVVVQEVTERKRAEAALRESEARFRLLAENVPGVIYLCQPDDRRSLIYLNDAIWRLTGYSKQEFLTDQVRLSDLYHPDDVHGIDQTVAQALAQRKPFHLTYRLHHRRGEWRWVHEVGAGIWREGKLLWVEGFLSDVTEHKQAEAQAEAAQQQLLEQQQREKERVEAELALARSELVKSTQLATIGTMSAQMAHEIRNPLAAILNCASYLRHTLPAQNGHKPEALDLIIEEVYTCDHIIGNLLGVTQPKPPRKEWVPLDELFAKTVARLQVAPDVTIVYDAEPRPFEMFVDRLKFLQVLDNLLKNALDAVGSSGRIEVEARRIGPFDLVRVKDTGCGVAEEARSMVFELFFTTKANGTGLGLGICRRIAEQHGGAITLASCPGWTTVFEVRIPHTDDANLPPKAPTSEELIPGVLR